MVVLMTMYVFWCIVGSRIPLQHIGHFYGWLLHNQCMSKGESMQIFVSTVWYRSG